MFSRPASAADSNQQQRLASEKGGSTACACFAKVCLRGLSFDRCAVRPQSRAVSAAVWRAAPDSRCPRRAAGAREQDWICPITLELMRNPVSTADGQARVAPTGYRGSAYGEPIGRGREGPDAIQSGAILCLTRERSACTCLAKPAPSLARYWHHTLAGDAGRRPCSPDPDPWQVYEREAIEAWLRQNDTSPLTGAVLATKTLVRLGLGAEAQGTAWDVTEGREENGGLNWDPQAWPSCGRLRARHQRTHGPEAKMARRPSRSKIRRRQGRQRVSARNEGLPWTKTLLWKAGWGGVTVPVI